MTSRKVRACLCIEWDARRALGGLVGHGRLRAQPNFLISSNCSFSLDVPSCAMCRVVTKDRIQRVSCSERSRERLSTTRSPTSVLWRPKTTHYRRYAMSCAKGRECTSVPADGPVLRATHVQRRCRRTPRAGVSPPPVQLAVCILCCSSRDRPRVKALQTPTPTRVAVHCLL